MTLVIFAILAYFAGSIPWGMIIAKLRGVNDIRDHGSGNIGATNVARTLGTKLGALTLLLDAFKGYIIIYLAKLYDINNIELIAILCILGHIFPIWLKFKGGKGVATAMGVVLAINPFISFLAFICWATVFLLKKYVSLASVVTVFLTPFIAYFVGTKKEEIILYIVIAIIIIYKHKTNIKRLVNKQEPKFNSKKNAS